MGVRASYIPLAPDQLERAKLDAVAAELLQEEVPYEEWGDIQKAWDSLWWLLDPARRDDYRDDVQPTTVLGRAIMGARVLNPEFSASCEDPRPGGVYGCTRYLTADEVASAAKALDALTEEELASAYDPDQMRGVGYYVDQPFGQVVFWLDRLRDFYRRAADEGKAVAVIID